MLLELVELLLELVELLVELLVAKMILELEILIMDGVALKCRL